MNSLSYLTKLISVWGYNKGNSIETLKKRIGDIYNNENVYITLNGRQAIYLFLKSLNLPVGSQIAIQAFTCNALVNPVLNLGLKPLYIDIKQDNFSMDFEDLKKKFNSNVKVIILQHTFSIQADYKIYDFAKEKGVIVLNDCAHTLGIRSIGGIGDATILSFGIEKMIASRVGGALLINNQELITSIDANYIESNFISKSETFKWLLNPILWRIIRKTSLSDKMIDNLKRWGILKSGFLRGESEGLADYSLLQNISSVLANIVLDCLVDIDTNLEHRKQIVKIYNEGLSQKYPDSLIRYPYICKDVSDRDLLINFLNELGYPMADRWYFPVIFPKSTNLESMKYIEGSCPNAQYLSERIVNLPTNSAIDTKTAKLIVEWIKNNID